MHIIFLKIYDTSNTYKVRVPTRNLDHVFDVKTRDNIIKELKERFGSIEIFCELPIVFKIHDVADMAAFLLWSSQGIEI